MEELGYFGNIVGRELNHNADHVAVYLRPDLF